MLKKGVVLLSYAFIGLFYMIQPSAAEGSRQQAEIIIPEEWKETYEKWGFAPAIRTGDYLHLSGVIVRAEGDGTDEEKYAAGFKLTLARIENILKEAGASLDDVIEMTTYHTELMGQINTAVQVRKEVMKKPYSTWTAVGTTALADPRGLTEIKVMAYVGQK